MNNRVQEARHLRSLGMSINEIEERVPASRSSISLWVRDIKLTEEQRHRLAEKGCSPDRVEMHVKKFRSLREHYQKEGRGMAKSGNRLHITGCMLYWAEGAKNKNAARLANIDYVLLTTYVKFLKECYSVPDSKIKLRISCYTDKGKTKEEIENFWLETLSLPRTCLGKTLVNYDPRGKNDNKRKKRTWGVCEVAVCSTKLVQSIFGAIQEYSGVDNTEWLDVMPGKNAGVV